MSDSAMLLSLRVHFNDRGGKGELKSNDSTNAYDTESNLVSEASPTAECIPILCTLYYQPE